jgi:uncharacterized lipoprotein YmbA
MNALTFLPRSGGRSSAMVAAALASALVAGCSSPTPAPVLLSLPPAVTEAQATATPASAPLLAVRRVSLPEYVVARRVRYRADPSTLAEWPNTYWAERIEIGVSREFVSALRRQLPGWSMCENDCGEAAPTLALQVDIVPLDFVRSAKQLQARARITLLAGSGAARPLAATERAYDLPASADTAQAQAEATTALIQKVAADAAALIKASRP